jgi:toxin ParE1/3/4
MAQSIIWSAEALQDISGIAVFISRDFIYYAQHVVDKIINKGDSLVHFSESGKVVPELANETIRETFIFSYRLIYQVENDSVHIIAIIHGKRLLENDERFMDE